MRRSMPGCCIGNGRRRDGPVAALEILARPVSPSNRHLPEPGRAVHYNGKSRPFSEREKDGFSVLPGLFGFAERMPFRVVGQIARALGEEFRFVAVAVQGGDGGYALFVASPDVEGRIAHHGH